VRAVLDVNVLIASLLSPRGAPARAVARWQAGEFELIVSDLLLKELARAFAYPKLRERISPASAKSFLELLREAGVVAPDPASGSHHSPDAKDDYLLALAEAERAVLVTGAAQLLALAAGLPILTVRDFVESL